MGLRFYRLLFLLAMLAACYHPQQQADFNKSLVLPSDKMAAVLVDIHLADGAATLKQREGADLKDIAGPYLDFVLEKHQVSREMLDESIRYYAYHMEEYGNIYEKVVEELGKIQSIERSAQQPAPEAKP